MDRSRIELTRWWTGFLLVWCLGALLTLQLRFVTCEGENVEGEEGSAHDRHCRATGAFLEWGEPSEWRTPIPYVLPVVALAALGGYGVWRRSRALLSRAAVVAAGAPVVPAILFVVLPR